MSSGDNARQKSENLGVYKNDGRNKICQNPNIYPYIY